MNEILEFISNARIEFTGGYAVAVVFAILAYLIYGVAAILRWLYENI